MPTVAELRVKAQELDVSNYKSLRKAELQIVLDRMTAASSDITSSVSMGAEPVSQFRNMRRRQLAWLAAQKGINAGAMTKDQLIEALEG